MHMHALDESLILCVLAVHTVGQGSPSFCSGFEWCPCPVLFLSCGCRALCRESHVRLCGGCATWPL